MDSICSNQGSVEKIQNALGHIVPHVFGEHKDCVDQQWCHYKDNPEAFRFKSLPNGKPFTNEKLRTELEALVKRYQGRAENLVDLGSTQSNENFNHIMASKAPKNRSYGGSQSLMNRLAVAVLQKNEEFNWIPKVNEAASLYPAATGAVKLSERLNRKRKWNKRKQQTAAFKKRRISLKRQKRKTQTVCTVKEGDTYKTNLEMCDVSSMEQIPSPPQFSKSDTFVTFDLETTGLSRKSDITQIAAVCGENKFNNYVLPRCDISQEASKVTGLTFHRSSNRLYCKGNEVEAVSQREALLNFIDFLHTCNKAGSVLVGHNISMFDVPILVTKMKEFGLLSTVMNCVSGYIDTLKVARKVFPKDKVTNYKQQTLVSELLGKQYLAHNAIEDVVSLQELFFKELQQKSGSEDMFCLKYHLIKSDMKILVNKKGYK